MLKKFSFYIRLPVLRCPEPPSAIPNGVKHGGVYEAGFHVNYMCDNGFSIKGDSRYFGKRFIPVICGLNGMWNADFAVLKCAGDDRMTSLFLFKY